MRKNRSSRRLSRRAGVLAAVASLVLGASAASRGTAQAQAGYWGQWVNQSNGKCLTLSTEGTAYLAGCATGLPAQLWESEYVNGSLKLIHNSIGGCLWARPLDGAQLAYVDTCDAGNPDKLFLSWPVTYISAHGGTFMMRTTVAGREVVAFAPANPYDSKTGPHVRWDFRRA
ncbi:hypothetical protein ACFQ6V_09190 [Streptomyces roseifaciens]